MLTTNEETLASVQRIRDAIAGMNAAREEVVALREQHLAAWQRYVAASEVLQEALKGTDALYGPWPEALPALTLKLD